MMIRFCIVTFAYCMVAVAFNCDDAGKECAVVYKGERCGHARYSLRKDQNISDLREVNFDESINSLVVTSGCLLYLFESFNFQGDFRIYLGNAKSAQYYRLDDNMAAAASSAKCDCNIDNLQREENLFVDKSDDNLSAIKNGIRRKIDALLESQKGGDDQHADDANAQQSKSVPALITLIVVLIIILLGITLGPVCVLIKKKNHQAIQVAAPCSCHGDTKRANQDSAKAEIEHQNMPSEILHLLNA